MHCYICDREDDLIIIEPQTQLSGPCTVCQAAINECLEEYDQEDATPENFPRLDHTKRGSEDRPHSEGVQPEC